MNLFENILLLNKPKGISSFRFISNIKKKLGVEKIGHAGTLDPMASGLMIVGINDGTKSLNNYVKLSKVYIADILFGEKRDTGDMEGRIVEKKDVAIKDLNKEKLSKILFEMIGVHELKVPIYSAVKVSGKPLYKYARGEEELPEIPKKKMEVYNIELLQIYSMDNKPIIQVRISVSSGSYIRTIAEEIGKRLGYPATLCELSRVQIGDFKLEEAEDI